MKTAFPGKTFFLLLFAALPQLYSCNNTHQASPAERPTILVLGGTPSTSDILDQIPDSLKKDHHFISFNRPGFGGTVMSDMTKEKLYQLAKKAGLNENSYGIIAVSGGAPLALLLADTFKIKNCGIISGMVSPEAYFQYADSTFTKNLFELAAGPLEPFREAALQFPNINEIVVQAGTRSPEEAIRASHNELNFILSGNWYRTIKDKSMSVNWWHGEEDKNCAIESVRLFLEDFPHATLHPVPGAGHDLDARQYIGEIIKGWKK